MGIISKKSNKKSIIKLLYCNLRKEYYLSEFKRKSFLITTNDEFKFSVIIFLLYEKLDLIDLTKFYINKTKIIVCTDNEDAIHSLNKIDTIYIINTNEDNVLIYNQIKNYIQIEKSKL
jgi:hypothetical protein